jgi:hypothetical protein
MNHPAAAIAALPAASPSVDDERERRVLESARRLQVMAQAAGIGWWTLEGDPPRLVWNDELRRIMGLGALDPLPDAWTWVDRHVHADDRERVRSLLREALDTGRTSVDFACRVHTFDGRVLDVLNHAIFESKGAPLLRFGMLVDVTERRQAARELADARERVALAVSGAGIGTWEWRSQGNLALWDEQMFRLRGLPPRPQALTHEERLALVHPDDREVVDRMNRRAVEGLGPFSYEFRVVRPDGQVRWLASRSVELPGTVPGERRRLGANWDVTDRRVAEQARREAEVALRESQAKSRFLARMSHELRTPLNAVLGFAQLLQADAEADDRAGAATRREQLTHIRQAGEHLLHLINDVLDLARIEGGELALARDTVALAALVRRTLPLVAPQAEAAGVRLRTGALDLAVAADETRLAQVLLNLLSNAVKYNRAGGEVQVEAVAAGALVQLRVHDTGRGIAPARLHELFQPFNRLGAEREAIEGSGIGLAIVKSLVERMGGHVLVSSTPGVGSTFQVVLPRAAAAQGPTHAPSSPAQQPSNGTPPSTAGTTAGLPPDAAAPAGPAPRRVLYIEDNEVNALIVREVMSGAPGYRLTIAPDGTSGLAAALRDAPELILLDMQLPDMDGFAVLRRLREMPQTAALPVVALSANVMPEQVSRGLAAGLTAYWTKPLDLALFLRNLARLLPPHSAGGSLQGAKEP